MENIYCTEDFLKIKKQKKKYKIIYFSILGVYVLASVAIWLVYFFQPYKSPNIWWIKFIMFALAAIFVIFSFIYLGIPFKRIRNYYKILKGVEEGTSNATVGEFDRYSHELEVRDGI